MGCASSKQKRCRHCKSPYSPVSRSYTMHVHHPPQSKGDSYHVVALNSTTLGSLKLDFKNHSSLVDLDLDVGLLHDNGGVGDQKVRNNQCNGDDLDEVDKSKFKSEEFSMGLVQAKEWSNMIQEKIPKIVPKTPVMTPSGEPETINAWEMMEGLEDVTPLRSPNHFRSFSFDIARSPSPLVDSDPPKSKLCENGNASPESLWLQIANGDDHGDSESNSKSLASEFDMEVTKTFRKSFQELSPRHPFHLRQLDNDKPPAVSDSLGAKKPIGVVFDHKCGKEKVVVYFTSLRGVRKTYEDCCHVRVILKGLGVKVDERDVSMHSVFKDELKELLGDGFSGGGLPRVFVGKRYIGGAEEIMQMHEEGQLEKVVEGCEMVGDGGACKACGDIRFVPCVTCSGSCKIYYEREEEEEEEEVNEEQKWEGDEGEYGFQRCPDCNENGLVRCPICCY